jgi:5-deoxy-glucuronate isomerase
MKRHYRPDPTKTIRIDVTPEIAGWKYLSFRVVALGLKDTHEFNTGSNEIIIVPLLGKGICKFNKQDYPFERRDLFAGPTDILYLPPRTQVRVSAGEPVELAIGGAPAEGRLPARVIRRSEISVGVRGDANVKRSVSALADSDQLTERLTVYEIHTPSGNWSSFPPHRHDTREHSSYHEETYYYRFRPANGFAIQRIYTRDTDLDVAIPVLDGDLVLVHEGYHPVVKAPGTNAYYLNFLAGDVRRISAVNDPEYDWVAANWNGNPIAVPVGTGVSGQD